MSTRSVSARPGPLRRRRPLVAALALLPIAQAFADPVTHYVTSCSDAAVLPDCTTPDDGTLRKALACALDGDAIEMGDLQCGTIALAAPLVVGTISLNVGGPGADRLTLDAGNSFRALVHNGRPGDTLRISGVSIANGRYVNPYAYGGGGGCIYSSGNVYLTGVDIDHCYAGAASTIASGGAVFAKGTATLLISRVTGSIASGTLDSKYAAARGGGVAADTVQLYASVVSGNEALSPDQATYGGGVYARSLTAKYSTISGNFATSRGGIAAAQELTLASSTVSGNSARDFDGGVHLGGTVGIIDNSTIAFNSAGAANSTGGISAPALQVNSSIIARNTSAGAAADIATLPGNLSGAHNLIEAGSVPLPPDTIVADPQLAPLALNGGLLAPTHALRSRSPAIDQGSRPPDLDYDERFADRAIGPAPDIGAFEVDRLFADGFD
jgi:hypothetical protein